MPRFDTIAVYIITDRRYGVLYTGVTSDLVHRVSQHRVGEGSSFTAKYNCKRLVWFEVHADMRVAIQRETSIKRYLRQWKINLIEAENPDWLDLWGAIRPGPLPGQRRTIEQVRRGEAPRDDEF
jgi:putative endonuclease